MKKTEEIMFTVKDYLELTENDRDELGGDYNQSSTGAKGKAVVNAVNGWNRKDMRLLPYSVQWSLLNKAMSSQVYKDRVIAQVDRAVKDISIDTLKTGVMDMLSGKSFQVHVKVDGTDYGLLGRPDESACSDLGSVEGVEEGLRVLMQSNSGFRKVMEVLASVNGTLALKAAKPEIILAMPYLTFLAIQNVYNGIHTRLHNMDWEELLKN